MLGWDLPRSADVSFRVRNGLLSALARGEVSWWLDFLRWHPRFQALLKALLKCSPKSDQLWELEGLGGND